MQLQVKGKPYIYQHKCTPENRGRKLSRQELQEFVTESLVHSYVMKNVRCIRHDADFNSGADFSFIKFGRTICGKVIYVENREEINADITRMVDEEGSYNPPLKSAYEEHGTIPRIYYAMVKCISSEDGKPKAGGEYEIIYYPIQWLASDIDSNAINLSDAKLIRGYANAWATGDATFLTQYLSAFFNAESDLAFDVITSKTEYLEHFLTMQKKWADNGIKVKVQLIQDDKSNDRGVLLIVNDKVSGFVTLDIKRFRISSTKTHKVPESYSEWIPEVKLFQTHGDHHAPFLGDNELLPFLRKEIQIGKVFHRLDSTVQFDENKEFETTVFSLELGSEYPDIKYLTLCAYDSVDKSNSLISAYPYIPGKPTTVNILDVFEWDNKLEATIKCRYRDDESGEEFDFCFFATDYYINKDLYRLGEDIEIALAASSGDAKEPSKCFSFEGQEAIDFLAKIGNEVNYDKNGNVEPVKFSTENLIAFLPHDERCPEEAEFQSPSKYAGKGLYYFNNDTRIQCCMICINADSQLWIPLFHNDFNHQVGEPISGHLWLSGRMARPGVDATQSSAIHFANGLKRNRLALRFIEKIESCVFTPYRDVSFLLSDFPNTQLPPGYFLFCAELGNAEGTNLYHKFYVTHSVEYFTPKRLANGCVEASYQENDHPDRRTSAPQENLLPPLLARIGFKHDLEAIWEAFLIFYSDKFLPRSGRYALHREYFFNNHKIKEIPLIKSSQYSELDLCPHIRSITQGNTTGYVIIHYWSEEVGLVREVYCFIHNEGNIIFNLDSHYVLIKNEPEILFREAD